MQAPDFLDRFYQGFMVTSEDIRKIFATTDMERLKRKLQSSLKVMTLVASEDPGAEMYLAYLGRLHDRLAIDPAMYTLWLNSLIDAVAGCDPLFDNALESDWRSVVGKALAAMREGVSPD
ncbi:MAG: hypothetical protein ACFCUJ_06340 [Thiotrichales bacterium]